MERADWSLHVGADLLSAEISLPYPIISALKKQLRIFKRRMSSYLKHCLFVQKELSTITDASSIVFLWMIKQKAILNNDSKLKLHYILLAEQIPPANICTTIKAVLKCFLPNLDIEQLKLPIKVHCAIWEGRSENSHNGTEIKAKEAGKYCY